MRELVGVLQPVAQSRGNIEDKIKDLKKERKYRSFLKQDLFCKDIYEALGLEWQDNKDVLS